MILLHSGRPGFPPVARGVAMFELTTKMTQKEFHATGKSPEELGFEVASSLCTLSDAEEESFGTGEVFVELACFSHGQWKSGEDVRHKAIELRKWADGQPVGRGHGSPYLQPRWAASIHNGVKRVEGRPWDGVRHASRKFLSS